MDPQPLSGRRAQAARNDEAILRAARTVFLRDAGAPVSAVAKEAGVGISALYRRYDGKEDLLRSLCAEGLRRFIAIAEGALAVEDEWESITGFLREIVDSDVHSLTVHLAGTFTPDEELGRLSEQANRLMARLVRRARSAGAVRDDLHVNDLPMLFEQMAAIRLPDPERTSALRRRYLTLLFDALRPEAATRRLPGSPATDGELGERWLPR